MPKPEKKSWLVRLRKTVIVEVVTKPCTREQAEDELFVFYDDEREVELVDEQVISVKANE